MSKKHTTSIRIFKNPVLEWTTHVHPLVPLCVWAPFIAYLYLTTYQKNLFTVRQFVTWFLIGMTVWTLTEYVLHRFVFHFPAKNRYTKRFVFLFHGLHHDDPQDPTRLVMPPVPAILIVFLLWHFFDIFLTAEVLPIFMANFLIGYLCYDYIHYATHHFPMTSKIGKFLRKYHLQHHYSHEKSKYGVSSPIWDYIFNTVKGPKEDY